MPVWNWQLEKNTINETNWISSLHPRIRVGSETIHPSAHIRNLGAVFDDTLSMTTHVNTITKGIYYHLRRIKTIRSHLDHDTCAKVINATITSRLDFNNSLLVGLPNKTLSKLQVAQNCSARLLKGVRRRDHITPVLKELHWLPVAERVMFKMLSMVFKALSVPSAPAYLREMLTLYRQSRQLRSRNDTSRLTTTRTRNSYGERSFSCQVSRAWNLLPADIRAMPDVIHFKRALKTHLFLHVFDMW